MIRILIKELIVLQLIHILLTLVTIFVYIQFIGVKPSASFSKLSFLSNSCILVECGHLCKGENTRDVDELIGCYIFVLVNN